MLDIQTVFPKQYYAQDELVKRLKIAWDEKPRAVARVDGIHENVMVSGRHLAIPLEEYFSLKTFTARNSRFIEAAVDLATNAVNSILDRNNISAIDISSLWSNTVTGFAIPSLEARLMNKFDFNSDVKRVPVIGLGCMAGAAVINRVADYLKAYPKEAVIFFSVELCSLTFQLEDTSPANLVSTGLFGDGAGAVLMVGDKHSKAKEAPLKWVSSKSVFFPDSESVMGWDVGESGLKIVLSKSVPEFTKRELSKPLCNFLSENNIDLSKIDTFMAHPGGPKVLEAMEEVFGLENRGLKLSWESLLEKGNMSSVSVLDIMKRTLASREGGEDYSLSVAMGPGFSAEFGLFQWN